LKEDKKTTSENKVQSEILFLIFNRLTRQI